MSEQMDLAGGAGGQVGTGVMTDVLDKATQALLRGGGVVGDGAATTHARVIHRL